MSARPEPVSVCEFGPDRAIHPRQVLDSSAVGASSKSTNESWSVSGVEVVFTDEAVEDGGEVVVVHVPGARAARVVLEQGRRVPSVFVPGQ